MSYLVHIGPEFDTVPLDVREGLRSKLENICSVLETLGTDSPVTHSLSESALSIALGDWRFRYELDARRSRLVVIQAIDGS